MDLSHQLPFQPAPGLSSRHLQMIVSAYLPVPNPPPSEEIQINLGKGDKLSCQLSLSPNANEKSETVLLLHGLGGNQNSRYLVRMAEKLYDKGHRVLRINLRNCGSGLWLSQLPYCAANSEDLMKVIGVINTLYPGKKPHVVGYSLGGNIALKWAGELGFQANRFVSQVISVCSPIDLNACIQEIMLTSNMLYHRYYLQNVLEQAAPWVKDNKISSLYQFDDSIIAPCWGYKSANDYYQKSSSKAFISGIRCPCQLLFSEDDPFVPLRDLRGVVIPKSTRVWTTEYGGHLGYVGSPFRKEGVQWLDGQIIEWIENF